MSTINRTRNNLATDTVKGQLLDGLANQYQGSDNMGVITIGAAVTDLETITITAPATHPLGANPYRSSVTTSIAGAKDVYQLVNTGIDTGVNSAGGLLNNTDESPVQIEIGNSTTNNKTSQGGAGEVGTILRVEDEYLNIIQVSDRHTDGSPIKVVVERGYAGSTIAKHGDGKNINIQADTALAEGALPIPLDNGVTAAIARPAIAPAINFYVEAAEKYDDKREVGLYPLKSTFRRYAKNRLNAIHSGNSIYLHYQPHGEGLLTMEGATSATAMTSSSNTLTAFAAGTQPLGGKTHVNYFKVSGTQASDGLKYVVPFEVTGLMFEGFGKAGANGSSMPIAIDATDQDITFVATSNGTLVSVHSDKLTEDAFVRITAFG